MHISLFGFRVRVTMFILELVMLPACSNNRHNESIEFDFP